MNEKQYKQIFTCIVFNEPLGIPLHLCWHHSLGIFMKEKAVIRRQIPFQYYMLSSYIFTPMIYTLADIDAHRILMKQN